MPKAAVSIKLEAKKFFKKLDKFAKKKNIPLNEELKELTKFYIQSVAKATPPKDGKTKPDQPGLGKRGDFLFKFATSKKRAIITTSYPEKSDYRYAVPFRSYRKKGRAHFRTKKDAEAFATIRYRNIGKWGWISAGQKALGANLRVKRPYASKWLRAIVDSLGWARAWLPDGLHDKPFIHIKNKVYSIARYGLFSATEALRKLNNKLEGAGKAKRNIKNNYGKLWKLL